MHTRTGHRGRLRAAVLPPVLALAAISLVPASAQGGDGHSHDLKYKRVSETARLVPGKVTELRVTCPPGYRALGYSYEYLMDGKSVGPSEAPGLPVYSVAVKGRTMTFSYFGTDRSGLGVNVYVSCMALQTAEGRLEHVHDVIYKTVTGRSIDDPVTGATFAEAKCDPRYWATGYALGTFSPSVLAYIQEALVLEQDPVVRTAIATGARVSYEAVSTTLGLPDPRARLQVPCQGARSGRAKTKRRRGLRGSVSGIAAEHRHDLRPARIVTRQATLSPGVSKVTLRCPRGHLPTADGFSLGPQSILVGSLSKGRERRMRIVSRGSDPSRGSVSAVCLAKRTR